MAGLLSQGRMALHGRALLNTKNNGQFWALSTHIGHPQAAKWFHSLHSHGHTRHLTLEAEALRSYLGHARSPDILTSMATPRAARRPQRSACGGVQTHLAPNGLLNRTTVCCDTVA